MSETKQFRTVLLRSGKHHAQPICLHQPSPPFVFAVQLLPLTCGCADAGRAVTQTATKALRNSMLAMPPTAPREPPRALM